MCPQFSRELVIVEDGETYKVPILPESSQQMKRVVSIGKNVTLGSNVYGRTIEIGSGSTVNGIVCGEKKVDVRDLCGVSGSIISLGEVTMGKSCTVGNFNNPRPNGNIIAESITVGDNLAVYGNVIATKSLKLGNKCKVKGLLACSGGDIELGSDLDVKDIICVGNLKSNGALRLEDHVIWADHDLNLKELSMYGIKIPIDSFKRTHVKTEVNLNTRRMFVEFEKLIQASGSDIAGLYVPKPQQSVSIPLVQPKLISPQKREPVRPVTTPQLAGPDPEVVAAKERLALLEEKFSKGEVTKETYYRLRTKFLATINRSQPGLQQK